jgi:hypothetical protein
MCIYLDEAIGQEFADIVVFNKPAESGCAIMNVNKGCFGSLCCKGFSHSA